MKIAFASCSNVMWQKYNQPIWGIINGQKPDLLLLLGDNIYMSEQGDNGLFNEENLEKHYQMQLAEWHFSKLLCETPYLAIWDNHDFGRNDVTNPEHKLTNLQKRKSRALFDKYLKKGSLRPNSQYVYCSYNYTKNGENVRIIMLDVRSFQENPDLGNNPSATLLGTKQEDWLLEEMRTSTGITIICSGFAYSVGDSMNWTLHKTWSDRFMEALVHTSKPIFLAGNNHTNEFIVHELEEDPITSFPLAASSLMLDSLSGIGPEGGILRKKKYFYEAISSSVGRNHQSDEVDNKTYANRPQNKYGIVNITEEEVEIVLYSQMPEKFYHRVIEVDTWKLKKENRLIDLTV